MTRKANGQDTPDETTDGTAVSRRSAVRAGVVGVTAIALGAAGARTATAGGAQAVIGPDGNPTGLLELTPAACTPPGARTPRLTEGPFFKDNAPERTDLRTPGVTGVYLSLRGKVYDQQCRGLEKIEVEFWQCDRAGAYDNTGWTLRGRQFTTKAGDYTLETVVPKDYRSGGTFRTPHLHVMLSLNGRHLLTTQLFFPDNTQAYGLDFARLNARDGIIDRRCTIQLGQPTPNYTGTFDFVVRP